MAPRLANAAFGSFRTISARPLCRQRCFFHSYEHSQPPPFPPAESAILSAALSHVPDYGFTSAALKLGARDAGYLDASTNLLPRGVFDLINYHLVMQRLALKDSVQFPEAGQGKKLGTGAKVRTFALARLRANEPVIHRWQEVNIPSPGFGACQLTCSGSCHHGSTELRSGLSVRIG
jgi:ubiquinone biosynthesis protein COQ9